MRVLVLVVALLYPAWLLAEDVVHTTDGQRLRGSIAAETSDGVRIHTRDGMVRFVPKTEIKRIDRGERDPEARERFQVLERMTRSNAKAWFELGWWARSQGLEQEARAGLPLVAGGVGRLLRGQPGPPQGIKTGVIPG